MLGHMAPRRCLEHCRVVNPKAVPHRTLIAGLRLPEKETDLGHGVTLSRPEYSVFWQRVIRLSARPPVEDVMEHLLGPEAEAKPRQEVEADSHVAAAEVVIAPNCDIPRGIAQRSSVAYWLLTLLRLRGYSEARAIVSFEGSWRDFFEESGLTASYSREGDPRQKLGKSDLGGWDLSAEDRDWLSQHWHASAALREDSRFELAEVALVRSPWTDSHRHALLVLWGGLESLFSPAITAELGHQIAANAATFLEERGQSRWERYDRIKKLYSTRSKAVHGEKAKDDWLAKANESYDLLRRSLEICVEQRGTPDIHELKKELFL